MSNTSSALEPSVPVSTAGPWSRFFARQFDLVLLVVVFWLFLTFILFYVQPALLLKMDALSKPLLYMLFLPVAHFLNACIMSIFGNSAGKAMFDIKAVPLDEERQFSFLENLQREFKVWVFGIGFGLPLVNFIALIPAFRRVKKGEPAFYDQGQAQVLSYSTSEQKRIIGMATSILVLLAVAAIDFSEYQSQRQASVPTEWTNPSTRVSVTIPAGWLYEADDNPEEGLIFHGFVSQKTGLAVMFAQDNDPDQNLAEYADSMKDTFAETIALNDWIQSDIPNVLTAQGETTDDKYPTTIYLAQNGSDFWRVVVMNSTQSDEKEIAETDIVRTLFSSAGIK